MFKPFMLIVATVFVMIAGAILAQPIKHNLVSDPSLVPLNGEDGTPLWRRRAYGDINKDGIKDLILSDGSSVSQNGWPLFIYFGDSSGQYWLYDTTFCFPERLKFERGGAGIRMWSGWHAGNGETILSYETLTDTGLVHSGNLTIYWDGGGEISQGIMSAVNGNSDVSFTYETYRIVNGKVELFNKK